MNALVAKVLMPNLIEVNRYRISGIRPSNHPWQRMPVRSFVRSSLIIITIIIRIMRTLVRIAWSFGDIFEAQQHATAAQAEL